MVVVACVRAADAVILINRVKPHTDFDSAVSAAACSRCRPSASARPKARSAATGPRPRRDTRRCIRDVSSLALSNCRGAYGIALVEDGAHQLSRIGPCAAWSSTIASRSCCAVARQWMPALPLPEVDVLVVDEIGKNISGAGMDTNIIGRGVDRCPMPDRRVDVRVIYARGLTPESNGNAIGIGLADIVSSRLVEPDGSGQHLHERDLGHDAGDRAHLDPLQDRRRVHGGRAPRLRRRSRARPRIARIRNTLALDRIVCLGGLPAVAVRGRRVSGAADRLAFDATATSTQPRISLRTLHAVTRAHMQGGPARAAFTPGVPHSGITLPNSRHSSP